MAALIHPLWDSPPTDAPSIQHQAHRLMLSTLMKIQQRVPEILREPSLESGERVMNAAVAAMLNPKLDPDLVLAALSLLQNRMASVDAETPRRLFLSRPANTSPISRTVGADLADLAAFDQLLESYILAERPGDALRNPHQEQNPTKALSALGLLMSLLVTRLGHGSIAVLGRLVEAMIDGKKLCIAGRWAWIDIDLTTAGVPQLRRVLLDPTTLAAWLVAHTGVALLPKPSGDAAAASRIEFYRRLARQSFKVFHEELIAHGDSSRIERLGALCRCEIQRLRMTTMPLIATFAEGGITSSSLEVGTWCRLLGHHPPAVTDDGETQSLTNAPPDGRKKSRTESSEVEEEGDRALIEQLIEGDLVETGLIADLRQLMSQPRAAWSAALTSIADGLEHGETAQLVVLWLAHLSSVRRDGKLLSDGSVRRYRGLLANRLLCVLPRYLGELDGSELEEAYSEVILSRSSVAQTRHIQAALAAFDRYVRKHHLPTLPAVELPGFGDKSYAVSSRILVEREFEAGLRMIDDGTLAIADPVQRDQIRAFWILAYRFGPRRSEILGLQVRDVRAEVLYIRRNEARGLKTSNANRRLPIGVLSKEERRFIDVLCDGKTPDQYLFFPQGTPSAKDLESHPVVGRVKNLLFRVSGDPHLHPHNLRHSPATLQIVGALGSDLGIETHPYVEPWMVAAVTQAAKVDAAISGSLHRRGARGNALSMMLGHGSELTTYEHYSHCFDLLQFFACWSGRFDPTVHVGPGGRRSPVHRYPPRQETSQLLAMLGYAPTSRVETFNIPQLLDRIRLFRPAAVESLNPRGTLAVGVRSTAAASPDRQLSLSVLLATPGADTMRGYPHTQADRDAASAVLGHLNAALRFDRARTSAAIEQWRSALLKNDDWASMRPSDARAWFEEVRAVMPSIGVEAFHMMKDRSRKTIKGPVQAAADVSSFAEKSGRYCVRFSESRKKISKRPRATGKSHSRSQRSVTWLLTILPPP